MTSSPSDLEPPNATLDEALDLHRQAAKAFARAAATMPEEKWSRPLGEGRWTPGEVCKHLNLAYEVLIDELDGGPGMTILPAWWQRILIRFTMLPRLLKGAPFPKVRAPREIRPSGPGAPETPGDGYDVPRAEAIQTFQDLADRFDMGVRKSHRDNPKTQISHAYFGRCSLDKGVVLCARHIQHHGKQIEV